MDITRATEINQQAAEAIADMFTYHPWDSDQTARGTLVRDALESAVRVIIENVPPSPDRSAAIRKIREARMDCNSSITHRGKY
jgi:hypothetical protein